MKMEEKTALVSSIRNLIHHVVSSRKNQEEIFRNLSRKDVEKIISNLEDNTEKLRTMTLVLLAELFYNNTTIKYDFCRMMSIHPIPGKIVLNNFHRHINNPIRVKQLYLLLNNFNIQSNSHSNYYLWFIDLKAKKLKIEYFHRQNHPIEPLNCLVGFILPPEQIKRPCELIINNYISKPSSKEMNKTLNGSVTDRYSDAKQRKSFNSSFSYCVENQKAMRNSLQMNELGEKPKQGITITSHKKQKSQLYQQKNNLPYRHNRTITLGGQKGCETTREKKNVSYFEISKQY